MKTIETIKDEVSKEMQGPNEILDFVTSNLETDDYTPEGVASYGDGLQPHDPRSDLKHKYVITVTKIFES